ncbi:MAG: FAD-binding oxidoreductase [Thermomicrobiales bacterium]|nr:FAD-binding oxidoreductase [Thermomicrobiales bacterium]
MQGIAGAEVVVIGGGLLGWSAAYRLVKSGRRVALIDRADNGYATAAGAGIIAPGVSLAPPSGFLPLGKLAVDYYDALIPELADDGETATGYAQVGMIFIARDEAELARLPEALKRMNQRRAEGMGNLGEIAWIDDAAAKDLFPPVMDIAGALHIPLAARVNGRSLRDALRNAAIKHGAVSLTGSATMNRVGQRVSVTFDGATVTPEAVVLAGGAWSPALAEAVGFSLPIYPQRGQIVHFDVPDTDTSRWPILEWFGSHYIVTFPANRVVCGATREHDSGYDVRMTAGGVHEVLGVALSVAPGLATATVAEVRIGLRPFSPDGLPVLGRAPGLTNLVLCTGHGPSGLQLGPVSGALVSDLVNGQPAALDLTPYGAERYQTTARPGIAPAVDKMI